MPDDPMNPPAREPSRASSAARLELSIALSENENTRAVLDGRISPDGISFRATPLQHARRRGYVEMARILENAGAR